MPEKKKDRKKDEAKIWGELPRKITLETITDEKIEVSLRFAAKKELQIIALVRDELRDTDSSIKKLISEEAQDFEQVGILLELLPQLVLKTASILMDKEKDWIEENLSFASIFEIVKPFFQSWVNIFGDVQIPKGFPKFGRP